MRTYHGKPSWISANICKNDIAKLVAMFSNSFAFLPFLHFIVIIKVHGGANAFRRNTRFKKKADAESESGR